MTSTVESKRDRCETIASDSTAVMTEFEPAGVIINVHGVGVPDRPFDPGEEPFWIDEKRFADILDVIVSARAKTRVSLTFDDGNLSDLTTAAPALLERGIHATFFVVAGRIGQRGFLRAADIRELRRAGFAIGSHGFDHIDWQRTDDRRLRHELRDSRRIIEDILGESVTAAGIPFGRYDARVFRGLREHGYTVALSSDGGPRLTSLWPIPRRSVRQDMAISEVATLIRDGGSLLRRVEQEVRLCGKILALRAQAARPGQRLALRERRPG